MLEIRDDGVGFDVKESGRPQRGHGLSGAARTGIEDGWPDSARSLKAPRRHGRASGLASRRRGAPPPCYP